MPTYRVNAVIAAPSEAVFAAVADLPGHPAWAADPLELEAVDNTPVAPGKRYTSTALSKGTTFTAELEVVAHEPPRRFAFTASDATGRYLHEFSVEPVPGGTRLERTITARLGIAQLLLFALVYLPVKRPNARKAIDNLKQQLERERDGEVDGAPAN